MAINFVDGKYVDEKGIVRLDPVVYKDWRSPRKQKRLCPLSISSVRSWVCWKMKSSPTARLPRSTSSRS